MLFPFAEYWWFYGVFTVFVVAMLALDLGVFHRRAHEVTFREALSWSAVWVSLALVFCMLLYLYCDWKFAPDPGVAALTGGTSRDPAQQTALEFLAGFLVEKSLSLDNIFAFYIVFQFFGIPARYQHRILLIGIVVALFFRVIFIALAAVLVKYQTLVILFGLLLILTGVKVFFGSPSSPHLENNFAIRLLRRFLPVADIDDHKLFSRIAGRIHATPLLLALVFVEASDIVFAVDSVPAIFAITEEPLLVYTSNVFAMLGLRAMYFLVAGIVPRFYFLKYGLALILVFVGLKMAWLNEAFGGTFPVTWSLGIILSLLAIGIATSVLLSPKRRTQGNART